MPNPVSEIQNDLIARLAQALSPEEKRDLQTLAFELKEAEITFARTRLNYDSKILEFQKKHKIF
jgi:hypothetical protein